MKTSELTRLIKKIGCYMVEHGGEHDVWYSPVTGKEMQIPRHAAKEIAIGTAKKIMRDAGLK